MVSPTWTVADMLEQFGPIQVSRIRTQPRPGDAVVQDVVDIDVHEDRLFELFDGVLVEKVMGFYESHLAMLLGGYLCTFVVEHDLGVVAGADGMLQLMTNEVRIPDVSFISWDRLPNRRVPREPVPLIVPDLAVEVISKTNTRKEMNRKLAEYFDNGVRTVWYVYPETSTVRVFESAESYRELSVDDVLDGGAVLPDFQLPLNRLFDDSKK